MEHEEKDSSKEEGAAGTEEVEEQGIKIRVREDEPADEQAESADSDDDGDSEVNEQRFASDATLKHSIAPIHGAVASLRGVSWQWRPEAPIERDGREAGVIGPGRQGAEGDG